MIINKLLTTPPTPGFGAPRTVGFGRRPGAGLGLAAPGVAGTLRRHMRTAIASGLLAAAWHAGVADATAQDSTLLRFRDGSYALNAEVRVNRRGVNEPGYLDYDWRFDNPASYEHRHIARVRVLGHEASGESLRFKVEAQPDKSSYELCYCPLAAVTRQCDGRGRICHEVGIGITEQSGVLYLVVPDDAPWTVYHHFRDFTRQRVELSVTEGDRKVFREVLIEPPEGTPDCSDYPEDDVDRYACLYLGETMGPAPAPDQALLDALPDKLVQPKANYELVFAEEFDGNTGRYPAGDCEGGLSNLDGDKWNFHETWCGSRDATSEPCETMRDGHYEMFHFDGCSSGINTSGKFNFKYGYVETEYTVDLVDSTQQNMNLVIGDPRRSLRYAAAKYGVPLRNYEEMSRFLPIEINQFEYFPERKRELTNYFYNYHPYLHYPHTEPRYTSNWTRFCDDSGQGVRQLNFFTVAECEARESLTVTKGLEWTPRGYRMLVKVKDLHDDFIVVSKASTRLERRRAQSSSPPTEFASGVTRITGATRNGFFEFLEPGNADSVLTKFAIGHMPMQLDFGSWGGFGNHGEPDGPTPARMKINYIRVFQPRNRYADMEPLYQ